MTKKRLLITTGFLSLFFIVLDRIGTFHLCGGKEYNSCVDIAYNLIVISFPIIPLFLFSLITFKMREEIFQPWWKFARVWIPVSMLAILISPSSSSNFIFPIEKGTVAFFSSALFVVISLVIIARQSLQLRKK